MLQGVIFLKKETLCKISNEKYYVDEFGNTYRNKTKLCNFWVKHLTINQQCGKDVSFTITLKNKDNTQTATLPIIYLNEPLGWLRLEFSTYYFQVSVPKKEFEIAFIDIVNLIINNNKCETENLILGWEFENLNRTPLDTAYTITFSKIDDPEDIVSVEKQEPVYDAISPYFAQGNIKVQIPLLCYMLLSVLSSFDLLGKNIRPDFAMTLTGGTELSRRQAALFFTNLYKRDYELRKNDYKYFHIMDGDSNAEIRFKAQRAKDCTIIAFEPDKRHLKYINDTLYGTNAIDENHPIKNMCLITLPDTNDIKGETLNVKLDDNFVLNRLDERPLWYDDEDYIYQDKLLCSVYYFIHKLTIKLITNKNYVNDKFNEYCKERPLKEYSEKAAQVIQLLTFAYTLYMEIYYDKIPKNFQKNYMDVSLTIRNLAKNSFPVKGETTDDDFDIIKNVCTILDKYFSNAQKHKCINAIGSSDNVDGTQIWYDDDNLYITADNLKDRLLGSDYKFSLNIKRSLAKRNLIVTCMAKNNVEYSVHIKKPLFENVKSKKRYIAFNRNECRNHNLFPRIENLIQSKDKKIN